MLGALAPVAAGAKDATVSSPMTDAASQTVRLSHIALAAVGVWALCLLGGVAFLMTQPSSGGNVISPRRALFAAVNAATLTGFEMSWAEARDWSWGGRCVLVVELVAGVVVCWTVGMTALARLASGASRAGRIVVIAVLAPLAVATVGGAFGDAFDALSAFANGGLTWGEVSAADPSFWLALVPLSLFGVLGPTLLVDALLLRRISPNTRLSFAATAAGFLACAAMLWLAAAPAESAAALASDARSSALVSRVDALPRSANWALAAVMLLGPAGGGVGGGLKVTTLAVLLLGVVRLLRGGTVGRTFAIGAAWLFGLSLLFGTTFLALLWALPQTPGDRVVLLAAGACANTGLASDRVVAAGADAFILSASMLLGRVLPWGVLWWSATRGDEPVAVG